jgi:hypothetical protein
MYSPHIKLDEPLKTECQHFIDCIRQGRAPLTGGKDGLDVVRILEASSESARLNGNAVALPLGGTPGPTRARDSEPTRKNPAPPPPAPVAAPNPGDRVGTKMARTTQNGAWQP